MAGNNGEFSLIYRAVRLICYILFVFYGQFSRTQIDPFKVPFVMATELQYREVVFFFTPILEWFNKIMYFINQATKGF